MPKQDPARSFEQELAAEVGKDRGGAIAVASDGTLDADVREWISTQCATLDYAIRRPGIPVGRLTVMMGEESSGKSTVAHHCLIETQQRGGIAILFDAENAYERERAERMGMDHDRLIYATGDQPLEDMYAEMEEFIKRIREKDADRLVTIVLDSLAACATKNQITGEGEKPGEIASATSAFFRKNISVISRANIALIFVNQWRANIDFRSGGFGPTRSMVAERSLRFYGSVRLEFKKLQTLDHGEKKEPYGILVEAYTAKNKIAPPFRRGQFVITFEDGIDQVDSWFRLAKELKLIGEKGGGHYTLEGRDKTFRPSDFASVLEEHPELAEQLTQAPTDWTREVKEGNA